MSSPVSPATGTARRIAIVSSLGDAPSQALVAFVQQLGLEPVLIGTDAPVSDDVAFMDRLEGVRGADYAIVLLPAAGLSAGGGATRAEALLEIGYLFGVLARSRVLFLVDAPATVAPELQGIVRVHTLDDAQLWHLLVAREMRKAGLDIDMNRAV